MQHGRGKSRNRTYIRTDTSTPICTTLHIRIRSQSPVREALPQGAEVLATSEDLVSLNDRIASIEERRTAFLELHPIDHQSANDGELPIELEKVWGRLLHHE